MTLHILARVRSGHEFATCAAINAMLHRPDPDGDMRPLGAVAIVPRAVGETYIRQVRKYVPTDVPAIPCYIFLAVSARAWHHINGGFWINTQDGKRKRGKVYQQDTIPEKEWCGVQRFASEIEMDYQRSMAEIENAQWDAANPVSRPYIAPYDITTKLHLLGGDLQARFVRSLGTVQTPMIEAEVTMFGREVLVKVEPDRVKKWAAE